MLIYPTTQVFAFSEVVRCPTSCATSPRTSKVHHVLTALGIDVDDLARRCPLLHHLGTSLATADQPLRTLHRTTAQTSFLLCGVRGAADRSCKGRLLYPDFDGLVNDAWLGDIQGSLVRSRQEEGWCVGLLSYEVAPTEAFLISDTWNICWFKLRSKG